MVLLTIAIVFDYQIWATLGLLTKSGDADTYAISLREYALSTAIAAFSVFSLLMVERLPRRAFIGIGFLGCFVSLAALTGVFASFGSLTNPLITNTSGAAAIALAYVWGVFYSIFVYTAGFFYTVEIFPNHLRARGMGTAIVAYSLAEVLWRATFVYAVQAMDWRYCFLFLAFNVVACLVALVCPVSHSALRKAVVHVLTSRNRTREIYP